MSKKAKHTNYQVVFEKNETRPCKMYISSGARNLVASVNNDPETVAMFKLFAAAPDMLQALESLLKCVLEPTDAIALTVALCRANRAIAKAKGEQP